MWVCWGGAACRNRAVARSWVTLFRRCLSVCQQTVWKTLAWNSGFQGIVTARGHNYTHGYTWPTYILYLWLCVRCVTRQHCSLGLTALQHYSTLYALAKSEGVSAHRCNFLQKLTLKTIRKAVSLASHVCQRSFIHSFNVEVDITQLQTDREERKEDRIIYICRPSCS